jgi:hypothetical protein
MTKTNQKARNMKELFGNTFNIFMQHLASANNITINELISRSNADEALRNEIEEMFLKAIKTNEEESVIATDVEF